MEPKRPNRWKRYVLGYVGLLAVSTIVRLAVPYDGKLSPEESARQIFGVEGETLTSDTVRIGYREAGPDTAPVVVLIHGNPNDNSVFRAVIQDLSKDYRVVAPDLPGFGGSTRSLSDYSIRAHARYVWQLLDSLGVENAHLLGYSMGGGVTLNMAEIAPERVRSMVLLTSIGVQELELLGDYHLNHAVHGIQLAGLWTLRTFFPHFGLLDRTVFNVEYAKSFFESDQRPLRGILEQYNGPMLIVHGKHDPMVPMAAAEEHYRIVPQSELMMFEGSHWMVLSMPAEIVAQARNFFSRTDGGLTLTRDQAEATRIREAQIPYDPMSAPMATGIALLVVMLLLAGATFVSDDLTCVGAGLMVARGTISFFAGTAACFIGIVVGDIFVYLGGRLLGRAALGRPPLSWIANTDDVERSARWFRKKGARIIITSRFVPGTRLPTYLAAGVLKVPLAKMTAYFSIGVGIWAPFLVGVTALLGTQIISRVRMFQDHLVLYLLVAGALFFIALKLIVPLFSWRGRRLLVWRWQRIKGWEFWPPWIFYVPVGVYVVWLAIRHRSLTLFTAVNPGIETGGFVGESKSKILNNISNGDGDVARYELLQHDLSPAQRLSRVESFMTTHGLTYPIVMKPDVGERGEGVIVAKTKDELSAYCEHVHWDTIVQEYISGEEFGIFYFRHPGQATGKIFSITKKRFPTVVGDGKRTLEELILADSRAVCMAQFHLRKHCTRCPSVPGENEVIPLVEVGTHCRGAVFTDGKAAITPALEDAIDKVSKRFDGFFFGRYDLRAPSVQDLSAGKNFTVVELNGATSESTNIYDPDHSLRFAYGTLFKQWRLLFAIAAANRASGTVPSSLSFLVKETLKHFSRPRAQDINISTSVA